jgi:hypothetical protein
MNLKSTLAASVFLAALAMSGQASAGPLADIFQWGRNNGAAVAQVGGVNNSASVTQTGDNNTSINRQNGSNNDLTSVQRGDNHTSTVNQNGDANNLCLVQRGNGTTTNVNQSGGDNRVVLRTNLFKFTTDFDRYFQNQRVAAYATQAACNRLTR